MYNSPHIIIEVILIGTHNDQDERTWQYNTTPVVVLLAQHFMFFSVRYEMLENVEIIFENELRGE